MWGWSNDRIQILATQVRFLAPTFYNKMKKWTKLEIEALKLNYAGVLARDLAIETGRTPLAIRLKARKLGLKSTLKNKGNCRDNKGVNNPNWKGLKKQQEKAFK